MTRKTRVHRSKSHKRRHSRRHTRKNGGGGCPCSQRGQFGGRGGLGGSELGHAYTTGASQTLYQLTGQTPGLSSGGAKGSKARARTRAATLAKRAENRAHRAAETANRAENMAEEAQNLAEEAARGMRVDANEFVPSRNILNQVALNSGLRAKELELIAMTNNYNNNNNKASKNFNKLMRTIHKKRMNNNND